MGRRGSVRPPPVDDQRVYVHALLQQFEYRAAGSDSTFRWEGEAWTGTDANRLWVKSEGEVNRHGNVAGGKHELLYDRAVSIFFDLQGGLRYGLDSVSGRAWAALGIEALVTQRLILQPQFEVNLYSKDDPRRRLGSGLSDAVAGLRLRYEISRKVAPYLGVSYQRASSGMAQYERANGSRTENASVLMGLRCWF